MAFVLGFRGGLTLPLFTAFVAAKDDLAAGAALPLEVLEGIRSVFHRGTPREETLRLAAPNLTAGQRMSVQKRAEEAKVDVKMDPADYDAVKLYVYAFEMGMTVEIARALLDKAPDRGAKLPGPVRHHRSPRRRLGVDGGLLGPEAPAHGRRAGPPRSAPAHGAGTGGPRGGHRRRGRGDAGAPPRATPASPRRCSICWRRCPRRSSSSATVTRTALPAASPRSCPSFAAWATGTPIYHLNPVFAAEAQGVRELCPGLVPPRCRPRGRRRWGWPCSAACWRSTRPGASLALIRLALPSITGG